MFIDKLYAIAVKSQVSSSEDVLSPRARRINGTSNARLAGQPAKTLKVPDILKKTSASEFFAQLERDHSATVKS